MNSTQNENTVTIFVTEVIEDKLCIMCKYGKKLYEHIAAAFKSGKHVILSFKDAEDITPAFLSETFSSLYANFLPEKIESSLSIIDISPEDAADLESVIKDVQEYLENPQRFTNAIKQSLGKDYLLGAYRRSL